MENKKPLWEEIKNFSRHKYKWAVLLIVLGVLGLALPVIPGILLLAIGLYILKPEWYDKLKKKFNFGSGME